MSISNLTAERRNSSSGARWCLCKNEGNDISLNKFTRRSIIFDCRVSNRRSIGDLPIVRTSRSNLILLKRSFWEPQRVKQGQTSIVYQMDVSSFSYQVIEDFGRCVLWYRLERPDSLKNEFRSWTVIARSERALFKPSISLSDSLLVGASVGAKTDNMT